MKAQLWLTRRGGLLGCALALSPALPPALFLASACHRDKDEGGDTRTGPGGTASAELLVEVDALVDLPFVSAGEDPSSGFFELREIGGGSWSGEIDLQVTGEFSVDGKLDSLEPYEARAFDVRYTGDPDQPAIALGQATLTLGEQQVVVSLVAVVGELTLYDAVWTEDEWGLRTTVKLPSAPYPYEDAPYTDGSVVVFVPNNFSDQGDVGVVTHIHGHNATVDDIVAEQYLIEQHALSGRDAIFIAPQGPVDAASGDFGRLMEEGAHARLVRDVLSVMYRDGLTTLPEAGGLVLTAHSGGYLCTAAILDDRGEEISAVHLFDALYAKASTYQDHARSGGVLRSVYTSTGGTDDDNQAMASRLASEGLSVSDSFDDDSLAAGDLSIGPSSSTHSGCVSESRAYARWLVYSGLSQSPYAPPELLSAVSDGEQTVVSLRLDRAPVSPTILVEGSDDGQSWETLTQVDNAAGPGVASAAVTPRPFLRVRQLHPELGPSAPSDVYGGTGGDWLVVDGFDRVLGGSYSEPTHDFAARLGVALGQPFSVASDEAVTRGDVNLSDYVGVLWMLGDESSADTTFDSAQRERIAAYVAAGGKLIVSGSELGFATDAGWLGEVLHVAYVADDAGTTVVGAYSFGAVYEDDYPDVLSGEETVWSYDTGGAAAVIYGRRILSVGFALETMDDATLAVALPELLSWLTG